MLQIIPCQDRFEELVQFAARLNREGAHHIGFFGEGEADVRASLEECIIPCNYSAVLIIMSLRGACSPRRSNPRFMDECFSMRLSHLTGDCFAKTARNDMAEQLRFVTERVMRGYRKQIQ